MSTFVALTAEMHSDKNKQKLRIEHNFNENETNERRKKNENEGGKSFSIEFMRSVQFN